MISRLGALFERRPERRVMLLSGAGYWVLYLLATQDLSVHTRLQAWSVMLAEQPWTRMWSMRAPFQFEPIALVQGPLFTWTLSPVNAVIGLTLAVLVAVNLALAWTAVFHPTYCTARPSGGILASLPGLVAGSACCGPALFLVLGVPVTASIMSLFGVMIPISALLLAIALVVNLRRLDATPLADAPGRQQGR